MPLKAWVPPIKMVLMALFGLFTAQTVISVFLRFTQQQPSLLAGLSVIPISNAQSTSSENEAKCEVTVEAPPDWYAPAQWEVNRLDAVLNGSGIYGFIFNSSQGPANLYNYCNMPHVNTQTYPQAESGFELEYVEVIHRHHKRTPYASNTFPIEGDTWACDDEGLLFGGRPMEPYGNGSAATYWQVFESSSNPMRPRGFTGTCQFPQITRGGLDDSFQHGADLRSVYHDLLGFLPDHYDGSVMSYRVTNNVITSQVASMVIGGMWPERANVDTPLLVQRSSIDSLEPTFPCQYAEHLYRTYGPGSGSSAWMHHLSAAWQLKERLDAVSEIDPHARDWSKSYDHFFDNLSSRLCHDKALPCNVHDPTNCITEADAHTVFRLGEYEYSFIYRDAPHDSLRASTASYGVWIAELAQNMRDAAAGARNELGSFIRYRHNVAHDGSIARLLSILQLDRMVWPGMGAEVVFEMYRRQGCHFLRVLWGGQVLHSSHPVFGDMDMIPLQTVLSYFDGLVGRGGDKVPDLCQQQDSP